MRYVASYQDVDTTQWRADAGDRLRTIEACFSQSLLDLDTNANTERAGERTECALSRGAPATAHN